MHRILLLTLILFIPVLPAQGSPIGSIYDVILDADVTDGIDFDFEGHAGPVVFDGNGDSIPNDFVPSPPLAPGFDLLVSEMVTDNLDGTETLSIWIENANNPGTGPLFANDLDEFGFISFGVDGLIWPEGAAEILDFDVLLSFGSTILPATILSESFGGDGFSSPLFFEFELDPFQIIDLEAQLGDWTDLHLEILLEHANVPEPALGVLAGLVGLALAGRRRCTR